MPIQLEQVNRFSARRYGAIMLFLMAITACILASMGRVWICKCGYVKLWHGQVFSSENSQHLTDWYTFTHILHGFMYYALIHFADPKKSLSLPLRFIIAVLIGCVWELVENSTYVIERYRAVTISLDYFGDSVVNSMSDICACAFGFFLASRARVWVSVLFVVTIELMLLYCIRDNLTTNIIQLVYPIKSLKEWQRAL